MVRLAFAGPAGSGKSTLSQILIERYDFVKLSFAEPIKEIARTYFGMCGKDRNLLQFLGDTMREYDPEVWITYLMENIDTYENIVIDDLRYINESEVLKGADFTIIKLVGRERFLTPEQKAHPSEQEWPLIDADYTIDSSQPLEKVIDQLITIVNTLFLQKAGLSASYFSNVSQKSNKNYERGRNFEYRVMKTLRNAGFHCMRKFGSHDDLWKVGDKTVHVPLDITAYLHGVYLLITVKYSIRGMTDVFDDPKRDNLVAYAKLFGGAPIFAGVDERRHVYFVNLATDKQVTLDELAALTVASGEDDSQMTKLMEKAWMALERLEKEYETEQNPKQRAEWMRAMVQLINVLNRILFRAGKTGDDDTLLEYLERAKLLMEGLDE